MREVQVMLDRDLAILYGVETRALKQAVKRNRARFPGDFMFELTEDEISVLVSQSVIPSRKQLGGAMPLAFTEQGVSSLSSVLTSTRAIEVHIEIMRAFVKMRQFLAHNADIFHRLDHIEKRQIADELKTDERFEQVFKALEDKSIKPKQGIFFDGQVFDAYAFVCDLIRSARRRIILIDNYVDESVLLLLAKRNAGVGMLLTKTISRQLAQDIAKFNAQYPTIEVKEFKLAHDRFLIIDDDIYHIGASLKDLGKKWFAFSKMQMQVMEMLRKAGI
ncbi:ORF6N domain-containing protein [Desulfomicrobium sp. ZS1]|uniref:ORF6N domain-containing protein n=1 Tax=Desulfomicrobium sp. ZS1 TaxID=2952228 RepID=UPI0020B3AF81|nr:ORF6N domain-containing protein [Desulfomicrobium sp. ZS1]